MSLTECMVVKLVWQVKDHMALVTSEGLGGEGTFLFWVTFCGVIFRGGLLINSIISISFGLCNLLLFYDWQVEVRALPSPMDWVFLWDSALNTMPARLWQFAVWIVSFGRVGLIFPFVPVFSFGIVFVNRSSPLFRSLSLEMIVFSMFLHLNLLDILEVLAEDC